MGLPDQHSILHRLTLRIYYEDTDFSGSVYHASYLRFMERARTEWVRATGFDQKAAFAATPSVVFVVRRMSIEYLKPALMDDVVTVETRLAARRGASLELGQCVKRGEKLLVEAKMLVASVADGRPTRLPREILAALPISRVASTGGMIVPSPPAKRSRVSGAKVLARGFGHLAIGCGRMTQVWREGFSNQRFSDLLWGCRRRTSTPFLPPSSRAWC